MAAITLSGILEGGARPIGELPPLIPGIASRRVVSIQGLPLSYDVDSLHRRLSDFGVVTSVFHVDSSCIIVRYATVRSAYLLASKSDLVWQGRRLFATWPTLTTEYRPEEWCLSDEPGDDPRHYLFVAAEANLVFRVLAEDLLREKELLMHITRLAKADRQTNYNSAVTLLALLSRHLDRAKVDVAENYPEIAERLETRSVPILAWRVWALDAMPLYNQNACVVFLPGALVIGK